MSSLHAEVEVELPSGNILGIVAVLVCQRKADLDDLEEVDITSHRLVVVVGRRLEGTDRTRDNTRELSVLVCNQSAADRQTRKRTSPLRRRDTCQ